MKQVSEPKKKLKEDMCEIISFLESKTKTVTVGGYSKRKNARSSKMGKIKVKSHMRTNPTPLTKDTAHNIIDSVLEFYGFDSDGESKESCVRKVSEELKSLLEQERQKVRGEEQNFFNKCLHIREMVEEITEKFCIHTGEGADMDVYIDDIDGLEKSLVDLISQIREEIVEDFYKKLEGIRKEAKIYGTERYRAGLKKGQSLSSSQKEKDV